MQTIYAFSYNPSIATGSNTTKTVWRMAYQQPILLYKGTANSIKLVIYNNAQKVVDLTDYDLQVQIVDKDTQEHFVTRTASIDTPTNGVATVTFTEADLRNLQHRFYHIIARLMPPGDGSTQVAGEILYLDDNYGAFTPVTIEDAWNFEPTSISTTDGLPSITFTSIGETPNSLSGYGGSYVRVNTAEDSLEFVAAVTPVLTSVDNVIPAIDNTYYLGNVDHRWHSLYTGNITITDNTISTAPSGDTSLILTANRHTITFSDNSVGNLGVGSVLQLDDISGSPGPRFETWYGAVGIPTDPPGQHSLDIYASDANSYVEFASYDSNTFMGVDAQGAFIFTNWLVDQNHSWYFGADGNMRFPPDGKISNNTGNTSILMNSANITFVTTDSGDGSTIHTSSFNESGGLTLDGDLTPVGDSVHSLGTPSNQWKDLYVSNTTIYLGGVPVSVDAGGNLLVNGNAITGGGGGAANTGNITFSVATLSTAGTNQDMTLDPNGSGNVVVTGNVNSSGNITAPVFISNITAGTAPFTVTSGTQVANLNVALAGTVTAAGQPNITSLGTLTGLTVSGISSLGPIGNVQITGGTNGQVLTTNGSGTLSWTTVSGGVANLGNLDITNNTISSVNTNGDIILEPNGTGNVLIATNNQVWTFGADGIITFPDSSTIGHAVTPAGLTVASAGGDSLFLSASGTVWELNNGGSLTLPNSGSIEANAVMTVKAYYGPPGSYHSWQFDGSSGTFNKTSAGYLELRGPDGVKLTATDTSKILTFSEDGNTSLPGDLTVAGNITIQGGTTIVNTNDLTVEDSIINVHSQANLAPWTQDDGRDIGMAFHYYKGADKHAYLLWQNDTSHLEYYSEGTETNGVVSGTLGTIHANIFSANVATGTAPFIVRSTTQVANLNVATAGTAATVTTAAQPNITSVGTLTALDVNAQANATVFKSNIATGTAPFIVTSTTQVANLNVATAGSATTAGTVTAASQPNITSHGTLTALDVNAQANATVFKSNVATGTAPFIVSSTTQVANLNVAAAGTATTAGTVTTAAQPNITSVGTLTSLTSSGTVSGLDFVSTASSGDEGGEIRFALPQTNTTLTTSVTVDVYQNKLRIFETGGTNRGAYIDLSAASTGVGSNLLASGGGGGSTGNITFATATISTSGTNENITLDPNGSGNVAIVGGVTVTANITTPILTSNIATGTAPFTVTSTTQVANLNVAQAGQLINGNSNVTITANSNVSVFVTGNATARAVFTSTGANIAGTLNATGNANVLNIGLATAVITTAANVPLLQNGTSNIAIASGANVTISSAGTANVLIITSTGANIAGTLNATGNANLANLYHTGTLTSTGNITTTGSYGNISGANVITSNTMVTTSTTFSGLPAAATAGAGARGFITDANTTTFASQVSGGGANALPVFSNGTNWYVG